MTDKELHLIEALRDLLELAVDGLPKKQEKLLRKRYEKFIKNMEAK